jgi:hypothetical protein
MQPGCELYFNESAPDRRHGYVVVLDLFFQLLRAVLPVGSKIEKREPSERD